MTFSFIICFTTALYLFDLYAPIQKIPTYNIDTISGDKSLINAVHLKTYVESREDRLSHSYVNIYQNKNVKEAAQLFYKRMNDSYSDKHFMQNVKDYRSFMRMKSIYDYSAETDKYLAFIDYEYRVNWYVYTRLELDVLNKETGDSKLISIDVNDQLDINDSNLESIAIVGDKAYVAISHYRYDYDVEERNNENVAYEYANEGYDYYLVTVDLLSGKIDQAEMLASFYDEEYWNADYNVINLLDRATEDHALISIVRREYEENTMETKQEIAALRYVDASGKVSTEIGADQWGNEEPMMLHNGQLLFGEHTESGTILRFVDVVSGEARLEKTFDGVYFRMNEVEPTKEQVIYFAATNDLNLLDEKVVALTVDTLELVYEGELTTNDKHAEDYELQIMRVDVVGK